MLQNSQIVGLVAGYFVMEAAKFFVAKSIEAKKERVKPDSHSREMQAKIDRLYEMHNVLDSEGRPVWYMPQGLVGSQEKILEILGKMTATQHETAHILDKILDRLDRK